MDVIGIGLLVLSVVLVIGGGGVALAAARPLGRELEEWRDAGLITAEQALAFGAHHATAVGRARREGAAKALGTLGAAAVGAGVILFFAANWGEIPRPLRVAVLLTGEAVLYVAGFWLLEARRTYRNVGHAFVFVGAILFGAAIFLVGQMYNVQAHDPAGFLIWSGGALATTLFFRSKPSAGLFVVALEAWVIHELVETEGLRGEVYLPFVLALYGLALYGLGTALQPWLDRFALAGAMRVIGFSVAAIMIFALSFRFAYYGRADIGGLPLAVVIVSAVLALASGALLVLRRAGLVGTLEGLTILAAGTLVLVAAFGRDAPAEEAFSFDRTNAYTLLFAALLILVAAGGIVVGALGNNAWLVNGAVALSALAIIGHFLDTAWARLPRSAVFVCVGALALAAAAALERGARRRRST